MSTALTSWYLLPPLIAHTAFTRLLLDGVLPPKASTTAAVSRYLLQQYLDTNPTSTDIATACEVVLDSANARQLLDYCPTVVLTPAGFCNGLRRRISCLVTLPISFGDIVPLLREGDGCHLSWLLRVCPAALEFDWPRWLLVEAQEWELIKE